MKIVDAVKTDEEVKQVFELLNKHGSIDYGHIWALGVNVALRISDLLGLTFDDIKTNSLGQYMEVLEQKTGKLRQIRLNQTSISLIEGRRALYPDDVYMFQTHGNRGKGANKPMGRSAVAKKFKEVGDILQLRLGTHSMRKTRGYLMYSKGEDIADICLMLNHSSPAITMSYIGLTDEKTQQTYIDYEFCFNS